MNKRYLWALIAAISVMFSLAACGNNEETIEGETVEEVTEEITEEEKPEESEEPEEPEVEFTRGVVTDDVYTSEFAGITFTAQDGFRYYDDSEIATVYGVSEEMLGIESEDGIVYDMYCINTDGMNISINYENLSGVYDKVLDEQTYLELSQSGLKTAFEDREGIGITDIGISTVDVNGTKMDCLNVEMDMEGTALYETIVVKKVHGYMAVCTVSGFSEDAVTDLLSMLRID